MHNASSPYSIQGVTYACNSFRQGIQTYATQCIEDSTCNANQCLPSRLYSTFDGGWVWLVGVTNNSQMGFFFGWINWFPIEMRFGGWLLMVFYIDLAFCLSLTEDVSFSLGISPAECWVGFAYHDHMLKLTQIICNHDSPTLHMTNGETVVMFC